MIPAAVIYHRNMGWAHSNLGQCSFRSSFFHHLFIPPRPTGPRNFKVRCLIPALSFATVFFHIRTHSTRGIFLAVIKLLETHQYSRPRSCISFLLNVTGQTTICPFAKCLWGSFILLNWLIGLVGRVFANGPGDQGSIPGRVTPKPLKMVLYTSLLNTQQYKVRIKGKVEQTRERSRALPYISV